MENKFVVVKLNRRDILSYLLFGFAPAILGGVIGIFISSESYSALKLPPLSAPAPVFSAVWAALFVLTGWASYIVIRATRMMNIKKLDKSVAAYFISLAMNFIWPLIFFNLNMQLLAAVWLLLYFAVCLYFTVRFFRINKNAGMMALPLLVWILYCAYINIAVLF